MNAYDLLVLATSFLKQLQPSLISHNLRSQGYPGTNSLRFTCTNFTKFRERLLAFRVIISIISMVMGLLLSGVQ